MSENERVLSLTVTPRQLIGLFLVLKSQELELDSLQSEVYAKIERELYGYLSIEDLENLETRYLNGHTFYELPGEFLESTK
ncbi:MAG: hypothetical protein GW949_00680 [Spirochaetales bacterium]|nr:hypothetical protein [Spirochaetales bacterium]